MIAENPLELAQTEEKTDFYVFSATDQGQAIGVIVSPVSGRIVAQARLSENEGLKSIIYDS